MNSEIRTKMFVRCFDQQRPKDQIPSDRYLYYSDIRRLSLLFSSDIFGPDCSYLISRKNNTSYDTINKNHCGKVSVKRLLYYNFVGNCDNRYLKSTCKNKKCCTIGHMTAKHYKR